MNSLFRMIFGFMFLFICPPIGIILLIWGFFGNGNNSGPGFFDNLATIQSNLRNNNNYAGEESYPKPYETKPYEKCPPAKGIFKAFDSLNFLNGKQKKDIKNPIAIEKPIIKTYKLNKLPTKLVLIERTIKCKTCSGLVKIPRGIDVIQEYECPHCNSDIVSLF